MSADGDQTLIRFTGRLAACHRDPDIVFSLRLAETGLALLDCPPDRPPAIVVLGPTQTGKSTVVNVLAGAAHVETSPLAAHTRRPSVLAVDIDPEAAVVPDVIDIGKRIEVKRIPGDSGPCLIWDTPDFDSNAAGEYRQQVAKVCALADLVVVVLSKEKYADQSVWTVLETIAPLRIPAVVCLNKCEAEVAGGEPDADVLVPVIRRRLAAHPELASDAEVCPLPRVPAGDLAALLEDPGVQRFRAGVFQRLAGRPAAARRAGLGRLVSAHWERWVAPVRGELACHREWEQMVAARAGGFIRRYRAEYIDHTRHHDVAQKAILGLLELLEFPALAGPLSRARRVLTWPVRKALSTFGRGRDPDRDQELKVLEASLEHCLLSLRGDAAGQAGPWWRALSADLADREPAVRRRFHDEIERYRQAFQPRIERLSEELYERLQRNPVTLNTLRATRLGADTGGIVLAVKTGTLGFYDALFAPAVVSLTSYLTESAVGQYLRSVIEGLKREQVAQVEAVIRDAIETPLAGLQPAGPGLFGVTEEELEEAGARVRELAP